MLAKSSLHEDIAAADRQQNQSSSAASVIFSAWEMAPCTREARCVAASKAGWAQVIIPARPANVQLLGDDNGSDVLLTSGRKVNGVVHANCQ